MVFLKEEAPSQILAIRRILEEMRKLNKDAVICFVDFKKAFDSISCEKMFEILKLYGILEKIISAIRALYTSTKAKVVSSDGDTDIFEIHTEFFKVIPLLRFFL